jgi:hypothetical protein
MVVCPKCGEQILYITSPSSREGKVYAVDTEERRLISKIGRVLVGYPEHICNSRPNKTDGGDDRSG